VLLRSALYFFTDDCLLIKSYSQAAPFSVTEFVRSKGETLLCLLGLTWMFFVDAGLLNKSLHLAVI
jgi:hypothetical protein